MLDPLSLPFFQRGMIEILILAIPAGLIGSWVVLRGLAFYSHAIGTAAFPGLVLADGVGFPAALGAFGAAGFFAAVSAVLNRSRRAATDSVTALVLVGCLAFGVILASDVFGSSAGVDTLLFGSLLAVGATDIWLATGAAVLVTVGTALFGQRWLARGFDEQGSASTGSGTAWLDAALLLAVAVTVTASLNAVGALLVSVLVVVPAATVRLLARRIPAQLIGSVGLVAVQGVFGLWISFQTDAPPGATIALVSGATFAAVLFVRGLSRRGLRGRKARPFALATLLVAAGVIAGCGSSEPAGDQLKVVATTTQVGDLLATVGGERVEVATILKPNTDPHDYEPRPSDVKAVAEADLVFRSGGHLDDWADQLVSDSGSSAKVIDLGSDLPVEIEGDGHGHAHEDETHGNESAHGHEAHQEGSAHGNESAHGHETHQEGSAHGNESAHQAEAHGEHDHDHGESDPHWWLDPVNMEAAARRTAFELSQADRDGAAYFADRSERFEARIDALSQRIAVCIRGIPASQRKIVTDHDAFGYFTHRFGIETVGTLIPALTTEAQPSAGDLAELVETIRSERVKAIFAESSVSPALAEAISNDTGASAEYTLYADTLGPEGSGAETWPAMMKTNTDNLMLGMTGGERDCFGGRGQSG